MSCIITSLLLTGCNFGKIQAGDVYYLTDEDIDQVVGYFKEYNDALLSVKQKTIYREITDVKPITKLNARTGSKQRLSRRSKFIHAGYAETVKSKRFAKILVRNCSVISGIRSKFSCYMVRSDQPRDNEITIEFSDPYLKSLHKRINGEKLLAFSHVFPLLDIDYMLSIEQTAKPNSQVDGGFNYRAVLHEVSYDETKLRESLARVAKGNYWFPVFWERALFDGMKVRSMYQSF